MGEMHEGRAGDKIQTTDGLNTAMILLTALTRMRDTGGEGYPITANSVAHLVDPEGRCTLESRQTASFILDELVAAELLAVVPSEPVGGDYVPTYGLVV